MYQIQPHVSQIGFDLPFASSEARGVCSGSNGLDSEICSSKDHRFSQLFAPQTAISDPGKLDF